MTEFDRLVHQAGEYMCLLHDDERRETSLRLAGEMHRIRRLLAVGREGRFADEYAGPQAAYLEERLERMSDTIAMLENIFFSYP